MSASASGNTEADLAWRRTPTLDSGNKWAWITNGKVVRIDQITGEMTIGRPHWRYRMSKLTSKERGALPTGAFAVPSRRAYPLNDAKHARNALARVAQHGDPALRKKVRDAVANRFPSIKEGKP